jgi:cellulose synthase/poly-beta-1,6-N-acetylglucosamine synthase-like glycosyltransferase
MAVFSVVIPALNAQATLRQCLESLRREPVPEGFAEIEIILADNGSTDATRDIARSFEGVRVINCPTLGPGAARNAGIAAARGEVIACVDSDCEVDPGWASALAGAFARDSKLGAVGGEIIPARLETFSERHAAARRLLNQEDALRGLPGFLPFAITANAAFRRTALNEVGVFDENLRVAEDADLSWRLQWSGWRVAYAPEARVRHHHRATLASYWRQIHSYGLGTAALFAKHRHRLGRRVWLGVDHSGDIRRTLQRLPLTLLLGRGAYQRAEPWLDLICQTAALAGRLRGSIRGGILIL